MIKAILMDFNGVIIDDEPLHLQAYREVLGKEGISLTDEEYYECLGMDDKAFIANAYRRAGKPVDGNKPREILQKKSAVWRDLIANEVPLFEGVENFVRKMCREFSLGIVSMALRDEVEHVLERVDLLECFSTIVSAEDVSAHKPDPECYRIGFQRIDQTRTGSGDHPLIHAECLVIEDSPQGIMAGKAAGLQTLGVVNTVGADALRAAGADAVARDLNDWYPESIKMVFGK